MDAKTFPRWHWFSTLFHLFKVASRRRRRLFQSSFLKAILSKDDRVGFAHSEPKVLQWYPNVCGLRLGGSRSHTCGHSLSGHLSNMGASDMRT